MTVTLPSGQKVEGRLGRIDDFIVILLTDDGSQRSFARNGDVPKVEVHQPLKGHYDLLPVLTDKDMASIAPKPTRSPILHTQREMRFRGNDLPIAEA